MNFVWYRNYLAGGDLDDVLTDADGAAARAVACRPARPAPTTSPSCGPTARARLPAAIADVVVGVEQPFLQVIYDVEVPRMAFGRVCLIGDAAFVVRPHAAAGTAKAAADAWALAEALDARRRRPGGAARRGRPGSSRSAASCSSGRAASAAGPRSTGPGSPAIPS